MRRAWPALAMLLLTVLAVLVPLAHASPPDPTWIAGLWDDGDHDDVVSLVTSDAGTIEPVAVAPGRPIHVAVTVLPHADERLAPAWARSSRLTRAPPASRVTASR